MLYFLLQDVLSFLENRKENRSWYKGSRIAVTVSNSVLHFFFPSSVVALQLYSKFQLEQQWCSSHGFGQYSL